MQSSKFQKYLLDSTSIIIIVGFVVVLLHIIDMSAGDTWALNMNDRNSFQYTIIYCIITVASLIIQAFLFSVSVRVAFRMKKATSFLSSIIRYFYILSHITIISSIVYLLFEQIIMSSYHTLLLQLIVGLSLIPSVLVLISLSFSSLKSFSSTKSKIVGIYCIAIIAIGSQLIIAFFYIEINLYYKPDIITPERSPWLGYFYSSLYDTIFWIYGINEAISFIAVWFASILLTKQYAEKIGKIKYLTTVSIPAIYFLLQYSPLLLEQIGSLSYLIMQEGSLFLSFYNFVLNTVNIVTGILFGISFFMLSKSLTNNKLKFYLILCGTGIMIIYSSDITISLILTPYPAWAFVSLSFVMPGAFLLLIGFDSATYYIASDMLLRRFLYKHRDQFELFQALGFSKSSNIVEKKIREILHKEKLDNLEIEPLYKPISESADVQEYVRKVRDEMKQSDTNIG